MSGQYEEPGNNRNGGPEQKPSRFRKRYRQLTPEELALHDQIKTKFEEMEVLFEQVPSGRYRSLAFTSLEEACMWIVKEITS